MRKGFMVVLAVALVAAMAAPALADVNLNGFVRIKPMVSNTKNNPQGGYMYPTAGTRIDGADASDTTQAFVDQRGRFRFTVGDENVKAVAFFESDFIWGNSAYDVSRNVGGAWMGDAVQLETKNVFVWFKIPNTSVSFTAGLQGYADPYYGAFLGGANDFAGIRADFKIEPVAVTLGWFKGYEGTTGKADDTDIWVAQAAFAPTKDATVGINFHFVNSGGASLAKNYGFDFSSTAVRENANAAAFWVPNEFLIGPGGKVSSKIYMPGINFAAKAGPVNLSGFALYQWGTVKGAAARTSLPSGYDNVAHSSSVSGKNDIDVSGYALDLRADFNVGPGKMFLEGVYASGDKVCDDDKYKGVLNGMNWANGSSGMTRTDMYLILQNADDITVNQAMAYDIGNGGNGMIHLAAGYTMPLMDKLTGKIGLGWLQAAEKGRGHDGTILAPTVRGATGSAGTDFMGRLNFANNKNMGTEVNVFLNYNIAKGLDFGLVGAYAWLGDAYKLDTWVTTASAIKDADNLYDVHFRLNYAF